MRTRTILGWTLVVVGGYALYRRSTDEPADDEIWEPLVEPQELPDIELPATRTGDRSDRGHAATVKMDLTRARSNRIEPVIEFLTFVQAKRGDRSHLMFVRYTDLDAIAEQEGEPVEDFLTRLDQLGVIVSSN